jgi:hypothetical protein
MTDAQRPTRAPARRCGAKTRKGTSCVRKALRNGRCPNHGGLSTGPKTAAGRARIGLAQHQRWVAAKAAALCAEDNFAPNTRACAAWGS